MPNAKDRKANPTPSILLVGDGGTRKTRFLATCPKIFIYDFDNGTASIAGEDVEYQTFKDAPYGVKVSKKMTEEEGIYEWGTAWPAFINHLNNKVWPKIEAGTFEFTEIAGDSITSLANICMNYVLKASGKTGGASPEIQHWGSQLRLLETVMDQLTAWPVTLIMTAHIKRDDNLVMGTKEYLPLIGGQLSGKIGIYFDEVWYTDLKTLPAKGPEPAKTIAVLKTNTEGMYKQAKTRHNIPSGTEARWSNVGPYFQGTKPSVGALVGNVGTTT